MIEFLIGFILVFGGYLVYSFWKTKKIERNIREDRLDEANKIFSEIPATKNINSREIKKKSSVKLTGSILTGIPVQTRYSDGSLSPAGAQQMAWCYQMLQDIGNKKTLTVKTFMGKQKFTKEQIKQHLASI